MIPSSSLNCETRQRQLDQRQGSYIYRERDSLSRDKDHIYIDRDSLIRDNDHIYRVRDKQRDRSKEGIK